MLDAGGADKDAGEGGLGSVSNGEAVVPPEDPETHGLRSTRESRDPTASLS